MTDQEAEALRARVEEGVRRLKEWPEKDRAFFENLPDHVLCAECYLEGWEPQPKHALILLCPRETGFLVSYTWSPEPKRLVVTNKYAIASDALQRVMEALPLTISTNLPEESGRWVQMVGMPAWTAMVQTKIMGEAVKENLARALRAEDKAEGLLAALDMAEAKVADLLAALEIFADPASWARQGFPEAIPVKATLIAQAAIAKARGGA